MKKNKIVKKISLIFALVTLYSCVRAQQYSYYNKERIGLFRVLSEDFGGLSVSTTNGIYLTDRLTVGINIGLQNYRDMPNFYPVAAEVAYFFKDGIKAPYVYGNLGYSFESDDLYKGAISPEIGIGWVFKLGKIKISPEISIRNERYKVRTFEYMGSDNNLDYYRASGPYKGDHLYQLNLGLGIFL